jgi:tetratricopeptide (TPR) repeat protein
VLLLGALLRVWHVLAVRDAPWLQHLQLDHRYYDEWGQRIAAGDWVGSQAYFVDPLYAYFLGIVYRVAGHRPTIVLVLQAVLGVGTCYLTGVLGRRTFGPRIGNLACLATALYAPAIYYDALIEKTALSLFLFTLSLAFFLGQTRREITFAAIALGLAALTRGNFLLFIPLGTAALLLRETPIQADAAGAQGGRLTRRLVLRVQANGSVAGRFFMASFLVVSVALIRNSAVAGVVATTTNMGQNLYIGNHTGNLDGSYSPPAFVRPDPRFEEADFQAEAARRLGRDLGPQEISTYWRHQALEEMVDHPWLTVTRTIKKVTLFWNNYETPDNGNIELAEEWSVVLRIPLLSMGILFPLAFLGGVLSFRTDGHARWLTIVAVIYCASIATFFVLGRFRLQVLPIVSVLAVFGATRLGMVVGSRSWRSFALYSGVVLAGALFSLTTPSWMEAKKKAALAIDYNNLGAGYVEEGRVDLAIQAYEKAVQIEPESVISAMRSLGDIYLARGDYVSAERHMRRVLDLKPESRIAHGALVRLYETMWRDSAYHGDRVQLRQMLAEAYRRDGRTAELERLSELAAPSSNAPASSGAPGPIDPATASAVLRGLSAAGRGHPVWFAVAEGNDDTQSFYRALRDLFVRAGWVVRQEERVGFSIKPGLFMFVADETPPGYVTAVRAALANAGVDVAFNTGYRSYYQEMKQTRPAWSGFAMSPEQTFLIVVGPQRGPNAIGPLNR